MKSLFRILAVVFVGMTIVSCSSDDEVKEATTPEEVLDVIISGQWEYSAISANPAVDVNGDGVKSSDLFKSNEIEACLLDNAYFFSADEWEEEMQYSIEEMEIACEGNNPYNTAEKGTYIFSEDKKSIILSNGETWTILKATNKELVVEVDMIFNEVTTTVTISFYKKV